MAFGILITYLFCLDSISDAVSSPSGYPFIYVFQRATGSTAGTTGLTLVMLTLLIIITTSAFAGTSRQLFAFARDKGMPCSKWLAQVSISAILVLLLIKRMVCQKHCTHTPKVHPVYKVPVNSILVTAVFTIALSLINLGSTVAFNAVLSLASVAIMATNGITVGCVLVRRFRKQPFPPARWSLGRAGMIVNILALLYTVEAFFWCFWPTTYKPTPQTFNWAVVLFVSVMSVACLEYWVRGRERFRAPVSLVKTVS